MLKKIFFSAVFVLGLAGFLFLAAARESNISQAPLARDYALNFWFDSSEKYFPANPLDFYFENGEEISGQKAKEKYDKLSFEEKIKNFKVFYTIKDAGNEWVYEYWLLYVFNDYENGHYGDWETVYVAVDKNTNKITRINGSSHGWGDNELKINSSEKHFWVYVGNGSHANCPDLNGDGNCNLRLWKIGKQWQDWDKNGPKISFDSYVLEEINQKFIDNFQNQTTLNKDKSPILGINLYKLFNLPEPKEPVYLKPPILGEYVGQTPTFPWTREEYDNPEKMRPATAVAMEKTQNFLAKTVSAVQTTVQKINPFSPAALVQEQTSTPQAATPPAKPAAEAAIQTPPPPEEPATQKPRLTFADIQENLDDITEEIDDLSFKSEVLIKEISPPSNPLIEPESEPLLEPLKQELPENYGGDENYGGETSIVAVGPTEAPAPVEIQVASKSVSPALPPPPPPPPAEIFITEVQIAGASADDDFIEIYNPTTSSIDVSGFQLKKRASTGKEYSVRLFPQNSVIAGLNYFLWMNADYNSSSSIEADAESSQNLAKNNSIALFDRYDRTIDSLAWGTGTDQFLKTTAFPENPENNFSLARKWSNEDNNYQNTNNNQNDFKIQTPTPGTKNQIIPPPESPPPEPAPPEPSLAVVINEIAWAGTKANTADEWIEFYNNGSAEIDISGWTLAAADQSPSTTFSSLLGTTTIPANGFLLLERSDDQTISDISADYIFTGALSNDGEKLELRDDQNNLIDSVDFSSGWPAGSSTPNYISMERISSLASGTDPKNWANNNLITRNGWHVANNLIFINGTPKSQNSVSKTSTQIPYPLPFNEFEELTLTKLGSPYIFKGPNDVSAGKTLKIEPGVVLRLSNAGYFTVLGKIEAVASPENKIIFGPDPDSSASTSWLGIKFQNSLGNKFENVVVNYGGNSQYGSFSAFYAENSEISVKNSLFDNSFTGGLWLKNSTSTIENSEFSNVPGYVHAPALLIDGGISSVKNSTFRKNAFALKIKGGARVSVENNIFEENKTPIYLEGTSFPSFSQNTAQNNDLDAILTDSSTIVADTTWGGNLPFVIQNSKSIGADATLNLEAGTVLKINPVISNSGFFDIYGKLITQGTSENPVLIASLSGATPGWGGLIFRNSGSILDGAIIKNGQGRCDQGGCWGAVNQFSKDIEIEIKNSRIEDNGWGITSKEDDCQTALEKIKIENTVFSRNARDIYIADKILSCPAL